MSGQHTVALLLVAGLAVVSSCSDDGDSSDAVATFSFDEHDLCDWVSAEEIAAIVSAQFDFDGEVTESEAPAKVADFEERGEVACSWELSGDKTGHVTVFAPTTLSIGDETYDYADVSGHIVDGPVLGHPSLSDGVAYFIEPYHNTAFGLPATDNYLIASFETDFKSPEDSWDDHWNRWFAVADQIMSELGWT